MIYYQKVRVNMERDKRNKANLEFADRLHAVSDEILGVSRIPMIMYENEVKNGDTAEHFLTLKMQSKDMAKRSEKLQMNYKITNEHYRGKR